MKKNTSKDLRNFILFTYTALSLFGANEAQANSQTEISSLFNEATDKVTTPFSKFRNKVTSKFNHSRAGKWVANEFSSPEPVNSSDYANMPYRQDSRQNSNKNSNKITNNYNNQVNHVISPIISPVRMSPQVEISQADLDLWQKPEHISISEWNQIITSVRKASKSSGIPERLILSLINKESNFKANAVSKSGAIGLTQIMPSTAKSECGLDESELYDIGNNIQCGVSYLEKQLKNFKKLDLAIASYNAGPGAVKRAIEAAGTDDIDIVTSYLKEETGNYVNKILGKINYGSDFI